MTLRNLFLLFLAGLAVGCGSDGADDEDPATTAFDRTTLLTHWADNVILPAYQDYATATLELNAAAEAYAAAPQADELSALESAFETAYLSWQRASPFLTGPAEDVRLLEQTNVYPTDTARLLAEPEANLELPSNADLQGFPALDYLLYGTSGPSPYAEAIVRRTARLASLATQVRDAWAGDYRDRYVAAAGSNASASVDRTVNDFIFWYEKHLRAGKVGLPAGVFSSTPDPALAEAPYHGALSRRLFQAGLMAARNFFTSDPGLQRYLDELGVERDGQLLSQRITANFDMADAIASGFNDDLATQVRADNTAMLQLYDLLQRNVILLKVDMLQALNINVDYVDADGD